MNMEINKKVVLITGIGGFAGSHLAELLLAEGDEVHGTVRVRSDLHRIEHIKDKLILHYVELTDYLSVEGVILKIKPDEIYHLAAQSTVRQSWDMPMENYMINTIGPIHVFEACRKLEKKPAILNCSTSEVYGEVVGAINEETSANPITHYGISKYSQDMIGRLYHRAYGIPIVTSRSFNVTGPKRSDMFADSNFAKQIAEIETGKKEPVIMHGNLDTERDFIDVRDVVRAYVMMLRSGRYGEIFCVGSGQPRSIQFMLDILLSNTIRKDIKDAIDPERMRPVDTKTMKCDNTKMRSLGWEQTIPIEQSVIDTLNYWRERIK